MCQTLSAVRMSTTHAWLVTRPKQLCQLRWLQFQRVAITFPASQGRLVQPEPLHCLQCVEAPTDVQ